MAKEAAASWVRKPKEACSQDRSGNLFLQAQAFERVRLAQVAKKAVEWKDLVCQEPCQGLGPGGHCTPSPSNQGSGWHQLELLGCKHLPNRAQWDLSLQSLCALGWGRAGSAPSASPHGCLHPVSSSDSEMQAG